MKEIFDQTKKNVLNGLVLGEKGQWISISEKVEKERSFLMHLEAGEVLCEGKWVSIRDSQKKDSFPAAADSLLCVGAFTDLDETKKMLNCKADRSSPKMISNNKFANKDVSVNPFVALPIIEAEEETKHLERIDLKKDLFTHHNNVKAKSEEYLEETMSFDMKAILNSPSYRSKKTDRTGEINSVADSWDVEKKKSQMLTFFITATVALFAIIGAAVFAFVL